LDIQDSFFFHFGYNPENRLTKGDKLNKGLQTVIISALINFTTGITNSAHFFFGTQFYTLGTSQAHTIVNQQAKALVAKIKPPKNRNKVHPPRVDPPSTVTTISSTSPPKFKIFIVLSSSSLVNLSAEPRPNYLNKKLSTKPPDQLVPVTANR
jgi:hypothetical protein